MLGHMFCAESCCQAAPFCELPCADNGGRMLTLFAE